LLRLDEIADLADSRQRAARPLAEGHWIVDPGTERRGFAGLIRPDETAIYLFIRT
jgi:hypothetical protein